MIGKQVSLPHDDQNSHISEGWKGCNFHNHQACGQWWGEQGQRGAQHQVSVLWYGTPAHSLLHVSFTCILVHREVGIWFWYDNIFVFELHLPGEDILPLVCLISPYTKRWKNIKRHWLQRRSIYHIPVPQALWTAILALACQDGVCLRKFALHGESIITGWRYVILCNSLCHGGIVNEGLWLSLAQESAYRCFCNPNGKWAEHVILVW